MPGAPTNLPLTLEPAVAAQVAALAEFPALHFKVENLAKGSDLSPFADRFTVLVPLCMERLRWQVIFNALTPSLPPDVIFDSSDSSFQPLLAPDLFQPSDSERRERSSTAKSSSSSTTSSAHTSWNLLRTWDVNDPSRLLKLVLALRSLYIAHQRARVEWVDDPRVKFELSTIGQVAGLEMLTVEDSVGVIQEVQMVVPLEGLNFQPLSAFPAFRHFLPTPTTAPPRLYLQVRFPTAAPLDTQQNSSSSNSSKQPRVSVDAPPLLHSILNLQPSSLPPWTDSMCVFAYLPELIPAINAQISDAALALELRSRFLAALAAAFGSPLEFDSALFRRSSFFVSSNSFSFIVFISVPLQFPQIQPSLYLQSSHHFDNFGRPITSSVISSLPWSPRWEAKEMATRIKSFVLEEAANFKRQCSDIARR